MTCPYCDDRPLPHFVIGGEMALSQDEMALYIDNPTGGDPLIVATIKRVYRQNVLEAMGLPLRPELAGLDEIEHVIHAAMMKMIKVDDRHRRRSAEESPIVRGWAKKAAMLIRAALRPFRK
ncbi:hypothetical protein [Falsirhodobacter halotolerans]|uniref:hypothetical protein n=1 Tax=Falsirhodobacter halotolerans TaxID=1146892 RepID=UPI001FD302ED|nr:hypothetical protein [Falsirhodobacter halotolerans]MCJ8138627.1 hypothetical protein [Falsirhodobacter halotolerans]